MLRPHPFSYIEGLPLGQENILFFQLVLNSILACCGAEANIFVYHKMGLGQLFSFMVHFLVEFTTESCINSHINFTMLVSPFVHM